jgi:hypothetical protein
MIKRKFYFSNPAYLSKKEGQLIMECPATPIIKVNGEAKETARSEGF